MTPLLSSGNKKTPPLLIDRSILEAAANWYVHLKSGTPGAIELATFERWLADDEMHRRAWSLVQKMERHLGSLPSSLALPALKNVQTQRRATMKVLTLLVASGGTGWLTYERTPWRSWAADYRTDPGRQKTIQLADGGSLELNTDTAVDIRYDANIRLMRLHEGEIMIRTAQDIPSGAQSSPRPFIVETPQGRIRALGTRFSVRSNDGVTHVAVFEHAVEITPLDMQGKPVRIEAGQQADFSVMKISDAHTVQRNQEAWTRGMLVAVDWRLEDFLAELSRYKRGRIYCDPAIADMKVTGAYRIDNTDLVLDSLTTSHPIQVKYFTRFWVQVSAKS
ncbi:FecR domain-containing protein [Herminiimonas sp.]|uniref:FecR domain-containing protein n=1 Tax=Herminiimonas sp. TaxID=1926289 RepID=UPI0027263840|nr:FecR domain-containing protein [Herminiimonas sp.]MDO8306387.1 FecR domain-containing protein [Herminiimonas sp.]